MQSGAVVIVSFNTKDLLRRCLQSAFAAARRVAGETTVIVVDNGSHDGSVEMVASEFPLVRLVASTTNLGFTGGNNLALALLGFDVTLTEQGTAEMRALGKSLRDLPFSAPDWVLLLNSDAELVGDGLARMVRFLNEHPQVGVCGAHLHNPDGTFQHGAFEFPSLGQTALDVLPLEGMRGYARLYGSRWNGRYAAALWQGQAPFAVDFVLGAAMLVRGEAIRQVGGLDDAFFLYCEEIDWCLRMQQAGWQVYALPEAHVIHHGGRSTGQVRWSSYVRLWRSRLLFFYKHRRYFGLGRLAAVRVLVRVGMRMRAALAWARFARGESIGTQVGEELQAYRQIAQL